MSALLCEKNECILYLWHNYIQGVPGVKVNISVFNSRADAESKTSYTWVQFATVQELPVFKVQ
jgi:hypothetical protein